MKKKNKYLLAIVLLSVIFILLLIFLNTSETLDIVGVIIISLLIWRYTTICSLCGEGTKKEIDREVIDTSVVHNAQGGSRTEITYNVTYKCNKCGHITHKAKKRKSLLE